MPTSNNATLLRRIYEDVFTNKRLEVLDEVIAKDCVDANPLPGQAPGLQGIRESCQVWLNAFPDGRLTVENIIADGELVCGSFRATGTHRGTLMGIQPTNKSVTMSGMDIVTVRGGKITHWRHNEDFFGMLTQLGVIDADQLMSGKVGMTGGQPKPSEARAKNR